MWCYETSSQQNWVVAFVLIGMLRRGAHAHIRRIKKDGEKALKVKTPFSIQCPDLLNERAVIQDWNFSLGVSEEEKQRHYQLQTLCNGVIVSCLNYLALFLRTGSSFFYILFLNLRANVSILLLWVNCEWIIQNLGSLSPIWDVKWTQKQYLQSPPSLLLHTLIWVHIDNVMVSRHKETL